MISAMLMFNRTSSEEINFPQDYLESRTRFRQAASALGAEQCSFPVAVQSVPDLSVDVALVGPPGISAVVISSGLHGVEGRMGAAVQLAWMESQQRSPTQGRFVLVHALNPYGYATGRRVNEDNVDLNRNFWSQTHDSVVDSGEDESVSTNDADYARFDALLNPARPPERFDAFYIQALACLVREGKKRLQRTIVTGQYDFPRGLFYGGARLSSSTQLVQDRMRDWLGDAETVCHIDFHSGLGRFADCQLLVDSVPGTAQHDWYQKTFGAGDVVSTKAAGSHAYKAKGAMGAWLVQHNDDRTYRFLTAEFGTYSPLSVLAALREENQAFHFTAEGSAARARARKRLERRFCPESPRWRSKVVTRGLELVKQATIALS